MLQDRRAARSAGAGKRGRKVAQRRADRYRVGDWALGKRGEDHVAEFCGTGPDARKRIRIGRGLTDQEARQALDVFVEKHTLLKRHSEAVTVGQVWAKWIAERSANGYPSAIYDYNWRAMEPHFGHRTVDSLVPQDWRDYAQMRFDQGRKNWTVHTELMRLRSALRWALKAGHIQRQPLDFMPSPGKSRDRVLSRDEVRALLRAVQKSDPHIRVFVMIALHTGARHRAILDLTWDRVDFTSGILDFEDDLPMDPMSKAWRKGRARVLMSRDLRACLMKAWEGRQSAYVVEHGGHGLKTVKEGFRRAVERAGLGRYEQRGGRTVFVTDVVPHTIRHTFITRMQQAKVHTKFTALFVGHDDEDTTNKIYTHLDVEALREVVTAVEAEFGQDDAAGRRPTEEQDFTAIVARLRNTGGPN